MRSNLMTFGDHTLNQIRVYGCGVDGTFPNVIASDEECGLEPVAFKNVQ